MAITENKAAQKFNVKKHSLPQELSNNSPFRRPDGGVPSEGGFAATNSEVAEVKSTHQAVGFQKKNTMIPIV